MILFAWSFLFWTLFPQSTVDKEAGAVKLYQQASSLIAAGESALAVPVLEQLFTEFPDSTLAPIAAVRVAETHLSQGASRQAVELLVKWAPMAFSEPTASKLLRIDSEFANRTLQVTRRAYSLLPESDLVVLEVAMQSVSSDSPVHRSAVGELAKRLSKKFEYRKSIELLHSLATNATPNEIQLRNFDLPLALLAGDPTEHDVAWIASNLETQFELSLTKRFSLQLAIAEAHRKAGRTQQALTALEQLSKSLEQTQTTQSKLSESANLSESTNSASSAPSPKQLLDWLATIQLRRSEIHLSQSDFLQARSLAGNCIERFPSYSSLSQFRFVIAKCDVADIDFEAARKQLAAVIETESKATAEGSHANGESFDQAWWMLGELDFMQRNYATALERYAMVLGQSPILHEPQTSQNSEPMRASPWKARALLQSAKCYEMLGNPLEAHAAYQSIMTQYPQSDVATAARQRLKALEPPKNNSAINQAPTTQNNSISR